MEETTTNLNIGVIFRIFEHYSSNKLKFSVLNENKKEEDYEMSKASFNFSTFYKYLPDTENDAKKQKIDLYFEIGFTIFHNTEISILKTIPFIDTVHGDYAILNHYDDKTKFIHDYEYHMKFNHIYVHRLKDGLIKTKDDSKNKYNIWTRIVGHGIVESKIELTKDPFKDEIKDAIEFFSYSTSKKDNLSNS